LHPNRVSWLDWGDICGGDPATDLAGVWSLFAAPDARWTALESYDTDAATVARAIGWAISFGALLLDSGRVDEPRHAVMGQAILARVDADLNRGLA